jgi:PAS domain S-box-containing protein
MSRRDNVRTCMLGEQDKLHDLLHLAIQVAGIGVYDADSERDLVSFSPELCTILGLAAGTQMTCEEGDRLIDERDRAAVANTIRVACNTIDRGRWSSVHRVLRTDGSLRWVSAHGQQTYRETADGPQPVRMIATIIDVTHLKETEATLRESERRLQFALDAAQMGTFDVDMAATQAFIDAQEARLLGLPEYTRVISVNEMRRRVPFEDLQASDVKQTRMTEHGEAYHHELRLRMPDGSERWLSAFADIRADRIFGVNFDVTERKRSEMALTESAARLRVAASAAALGVFEWDAGADRAVWENDRMYEIFHRTREEGPLNKQQFVDAYLHPHDVAGFEDQLNNAMRASGTFHTICRIRLNDRSLRWLRFDGSFTARDGGRVQRLVGVVADITEQRQLERRTQRLSARLARIQEEERQKIAQELHDSTVQHLVAANLTIMRLKASTHTGVEDESLWRDLETSIDAATKELRTFSYLTHTPALQAHGLCFSLHQYTDGLAKRCGITINLKANRNVDRLTLGKQRALFRIIQDALGNVCRHASASHVTVAVRWIGNCVHILVTDNGQGIPPGHRRSALLRHGPSTLGFKPPSGSGSSRNIRITQARPHGARLHVALYVERPRRKSSHRATLT